MKAFVVNDSGHDYSPASDFGEVVVLSTGLINKFNLTEMLRTFDPWIDKSSKDDYIVQSGPAVMFALVCAAFAARHGRVNILLWKADKERGRYVPRSVVLKGT